MFGRSTAEIDAHVGLLLSDNTKVIYSDALESDYSADEVTGVYVDRQIDIGASARLCIHPTVDRQCYYAPGGCACTNKVSTGTSAEAARLCDGQQYTSIAVTDLGGHSSYNDGAYAACLADACTFANGSKGYIMSTGEWSVVQLYMRPINELLEHIGGVQFVAGISDTNYWLSTLNSISASGYYVNVWIAVNYQGWLIDGCNVQAYVHARPVCKLPD